ncbi:hypothetical protein KI688_005741 [Linnemannia hyalina]|uniref:Uncharacterized protein n=1 Tax=Linnemannia hyalina TaxID=64524 RepID=A0A9P8BWG4_9FUNG|nr:hypothetical protein KI688_005741 [Linnemannia hyalina]
MRLTQGHAPRRGRIRGSKAENLPDPPTSAGDPVPERFKSNILLGVLEKRKIYRFWCQVSFQLWITYGTGAGKTRTMIAMLYLQWGFYFNASSKDLGSDDLFRLAEFIDGNTLDDSASINTHFAKSATLLLLLSRLMILSYCLKVSGCRQTFSSARWALLQVCPHMFKDVFMHLFIKLRDLMKGRALLESHLASIVRDEFELLQDKPAALDYPNFSSDSKLRLVIDEAQLLSDKSPTSFASSFTQGDPRPIGDDIKSLEDKIAKNPELFTSCSSIKESLGLFLYRHRLLDAPSTMIKNDMQLFEAAFGRINLFGGSARTVLDRPLEFMKAHVENNSKQDGQDVPPFYVPAPHVSGPDIIFSSGSMEKSLRASFNMVIAYPAEVVNFQVVRPDPKPELEGLQRVSIGIDDRNFPRSFHAVMSSFWTR